MVFKAWPGKGAVASEKSKDTEQNFLHEMLTSIPEV